MAEAKPSALSRDAILLVKYGAGRGPTFCSIDEQSKASFGFCQAKSRASWPRQLVCPDAFAQAGEPKTVVIIPPLWYNGPTVL
jgi:hypothetical protein